MLNSTNKEYKKIQKLSVTLNNVNDELEENRNKIKILTDNNKALDIKVNYLENTVDNQNKEIDNLKNENFKLKTPLNYFESLFKRLINFIKKQLFRKDKTRDDYMKFYNDLYNHGILSSDNISDIRNSYNQSKTLNSNDERDNR